MPDIEREVKRLLRMDNEAIDVKWEVVIESDKPQDAHSGEKQVCVVCDVEWEVVIESDKPQDAHSGETGACVSCVTSSGQCCTQRGI